MAGMLGSDPNDMADLVNKIGHAVDQIHTVTSTLDSKAQSVRWEGPDANRFKSSEWPSYKASLQRVAQDLEQVKNLVNKQKEQQINASA
ncbi:uncharacterized protein YukE [Arthrobacter silviterrae]|jgi:uncharacterized protein YukE|uniref:WXG100 family type VII secretion target n=1 Tax=Arthrobacter silviterrae TaxID=2026658 RepID=A0ABX0DDT0_9MICC|nr:hypothetical protein [Arthrobacter silviterrae]MDQ0278337.1 uncharacterized protein YukE [Arthrobacter silviterrae]MDQ0279057.1 uncharacterized protein YukE [Arthrobacter silviterrae]NGN84474.1 hypothetical protein [Arthrobacter silviterrae]NGN85093.1 hypothetical protein [Arthrobacter silviterrae]